MWEKILMRCVAFCTATSYKLVAIADFFRAKHCVINFNRTVLHVTKKGVAWDLYFFSQGCFVTWGLGRKQEQAYLEQMKKFANDALEAPEVSYYTFCLGKETKIVPHARFNADVIILDAEEAENAQIKLAISYGLAQSVKLEAYEDSIQKTIDYNQRIPIDLAKYGKISLSRRSISKRIGEIFLERSFVNLTSESFDVPEYFWQYPQLESYYAMTEKFLDIPQRVASLNRKLDVLHELFEVLNDQLQHRYSSMLESIIILLILLEIILSVFHRV